MKKTFPSSSARVTLSPSAVVRVADRLICRLPSVVASEKESEEQPGSQKIAAHSARVGKPTLRQRLGENFFILSNNVARKTSIAGKNRINPPDEGRISNNQQNPRGAAVRLMSLWADPNGPYDEAILARSMRGDYNLRKRSRQRLKTDAIDAQRWAQMAAARDLRPTLAFSKRRR